CPAGTGAAWMRGPSIPPQQQRPVSIAPIRHQTGPRVLHLSRLAAPPELEAALVGMAITVEPPGRELAAAGVERQFAVEGGAGAALDEARGFARRAEADGF